LRQNSKFTKGTQKIGSTPLPDSNGCQLNTEVFHYFLTLRVVRLLFNAEISEHRPTIIIQLNFASMAYSFKN